MTPLSEVHESATDDAAPDDAATICVLLIEARVGTASVIRSLLTTSAAAPFTVLRTATIDAGLDALDFGGVDIVVLGSEVPADQPSLEVLLERSSGLPVIALTSSDDPAVATRLIDRGLHDCVPSSRISADALGWAVVRSVHRVRAGRGAAASTAAAHDPSRATRLTVADARAPLTALVDLLELLTSAWDALTEDHKLNMLATIRSYAATVEQLTSDLLSIASIDVDATASTPQLIPLARVVNHAAMVEAHPETVVDIDPHLVVWADADHLARMVAVLLAHAGQRSPSGLVVRAVAGGATVRLSIGSTDASPRDRTRGWSLLHPDPATFDDDEGVGLDVARRLAEANGGIAGVDELSGSVWARLPSAPPEPEADVPA